jgi:hypothetical protein
MAVCINLQAILHWCVFLAVVGDVVGRPFRRRCRGCEVRQVGGSHHASIFYLATAGIHGQVLLLPMEIKECFWNFIHSWLCSTARFRYFLLFSDERGETGAPLIIWRDINRCLDKWSLRSKLYLTFSFIVIWYWSYYRSSTLNHDRLVWVAASKF